MWVSTSFTASRYCDDMKPYWWPAESVAARWMKLNVFGLVASWFTSAEVVTEPAPRR